MDEREIYQCVKDGDVAWHCGTKTGYKHPLCRNDNSIGIELCSRIKDGRYYFLEGTCENALWLTRNLMARYGVPLQNVLRHFDVTGKICPEPFVSDESAWTSFKARLEAQEKIKEYTDINDIAWELCNRSIVSDCAGLIAEVAQNPTGRLYHLARKCVQYMRERE